MKAPRTIPPPVRAAQARASDPAASAFVSANAGSGKTHVLVQRVIRLLLAGVLPERILCLTFTKAAAANMAERVFTRLGQWVRLSASSFDSTLFTARIIIRHGIYLLGRLFRSTYRSVYGIRNRYFDNLRRDLMVPGGKISRPLLEA